MVAELTKATTDDGTLAPTLLAALPPDMRLMMGDSNDNTPEIPAVCQPDKCSQWVVASSLFCDLLEY